MLRRPRNPLALSTMFLRRSRDAGALVALGICFLVSFGWLLLVVNVRRVSPADMPSNYKERAGALDLCRLRLRERHALFDAGNHGLVDLADLAETALPLRTLARCEMAQTRLTTQDLACRGDFEPLGC